MDWLKMKSKHLSAVFGLLNSALQLHAWQFPRDMSKAGVCCPLTRRGLFCLSKLEQFEETLRIDTTLVTQSTTQETTRLEFVIGRLLAKLAASRRSICLYNADGKFPGKAFISKDDVAKIYRAGHNAQEEAKSEQREKYIW